MVHGPMDLLDSLSQTPWLTFEYLPKVPTLSASYYTAGMHACGCVNLPYIYTARVRRFWDSRADHVEAVYTGLARWLKHIL